MQAARLTRRAPALERRGCKTTLWLYLTMAQNKNRPVKTTHTPQSDPGKGFVPPELRCFNMQDDFFTGAELNLQKITQSRVNALTSLRKNCDFEKNEGNNSLMAQPHVQQLDLKYTIDQQKPRA